MTGVCGIKPTFGWVDRTGVAPLSPSFDTLGPVARTAEDCRLLLSQMVAPARRHTLLAPPPPDLLNRTRIGVPESYIAAAGGQADILAAYHTALDYLLSAGARLVPLDIAFLAHARAINWTILRFEAFQTHRGLLAACGEHYSPQFRRGILADSVVTSADYRRARQARTVVARALADAFAKCDVIATPTIPSSFGSAPWVQSPASSGEGVARTAEVYESPFNLSGGPAISVPCGFNREGVPIGLQLGAARDDDARLLHVAEAFARSAGFERHAPAFIGYP
jgi:Asp-tRNA(Asn)/Glu-tRNA(Gln) amidotransferase A subunit family amidase